MNTRGVNEVRIGLNPDRLDETEIEAIRSEIAAQLSSTQVTLDGDQIIITGKNNLHVLFGGRDTVSISVERSRESMYRVLSGSDDVEVITVDGEEVWSNVTQ